MRHHQTRRRRPHLKKQTRRTRRTQHGGDLPVPITSAKEWFKAIQDFEENKLFNGDYSLEGLRSDTLTLPSPIAGENNTPFIIPGIQTVYPDYQTLQEPQESRFDLRELALGVGTLFKGEGLTGGLLSKGYNTSMKLNAFFNKAKDVPENTQPGDDNYENKRTVWFLNEIEKALQKAASTEIGDTQRLKSIYDKPESPTDKFPPFYIWYLVMNPITVKEQDIRPVFVGVPPDILSQIKQEAPAAPAT